ncbi:hypothetical protein AB1Y20_017442 [Prymnesium parvum]|uniref:Kinesin-like protein n=1 Tax=Prymnesium parvum TaxID=97485 RepID=A0AB34JLM8_PRYPA|mmetsp:Transcript_33957/g.77859  ORF Transcript_33957/g.77859 Transcript_33957/m.77859 type:complete len:835 (-) Transcript_33957:471-2975(-)
MPAAETVKVVVRCRPLNSTEIQDGRTQIVQMDGRVGTVAVTVPKSQEPPKTFTFDAVYPPNTAQEFIYQGTAKPILDSVMEGYNGTIFAYGQTGTGKTFTMEGVPEPAELKGIIPRAFAEIFEQVLVQGKETVEFLVRASYLEIYNEEIRDLLSKNPHNKLDLKESPESGVYVRDLTSYVVKTTRECDKLRDFGAKNRHVGATAMNQDSSRSHSIYTITVESCETRADGSTSIRMGKLNLVDLAGSERQSKTQASGDRLKEATKINLSLSALGNCISALVDGKSTHIPYRDSKLTRLLQDSLGGNTKTVMVANLGPADWNYDETLSTLRYANRAKNIKNKPKINEDPKDAMLREFQDEIARLRAKLEQTGSDGSGRPRTPGSLTGSITEKKVVDVVQEKLVQVEKLIEVEREVEVERIVEVEKVVDVEKVIERPVEVERVVERYVEVPVERIVEIEKLIGLREEEVEAMRSDIRSRAQAEREELIRQGLIERQSIEARARQLEEEQARAAAEAAERERVAAELAEIEGKIMHGGEHVRDRVTRQEQLIKARELELIAQRERETKLAQERIRLEEERLAQEDHYRSLEEEAETKTRKLKQLYAKFRAAKSEVSDLQAEQQQEKEDLLHTVRELTRQLHLQNMVIDAFVPAEELAKLEKRAVWDEDGSEEWRLLPRSEVNDPEEDARPRSHPGLIRPTSAFACEIASDLSNNNPRFRADNVLSFDLDMPERTTADYENDVNPTVRAALSAALQDDEHLEVEAQENLPSMDGWTPEAQSLSRGGRLTAAGAATKTAAKARRKKAVSKETNAFDALLSNSNETNVASAFPQARGLVKR